MKIKILALCAALTLTCLTAAGCKNDKQSDTQQNNTANTAAADSFVPYQDESKKAVQDECTQNAKLIYRAAQAVVSERIADGETIEDATYISGDGSVFMEKVNDKYVNDINESYVTIMVQNSSVLMVIFKQTEDADIFGSCTG